MNLNNLKKQREFDFLLEFKEAVNFDFDVIEKNRECPDFIICYNNDKIGVEVTEYFIDIRNNSNKGSRLKNLESIEQGIINNALKYYLTTSRPSLSVKVNFISGIVFRENDRKKISKLLCKYLSNIAIDIWENVDVLGNHDSNELSKYFSLVHATRIQDGNENSWQNIKWGIVADITENIIFDIIRSKENKLGEYKKNTDFNWLLIVSDGRYPSSMVGISDKFNFIVDSEFDKIFFLSYPKVRIIELK